VSTPLPDPIVVSIPPGPTFTVGRIPATWWKTPPYGDAGWQLNLRGFMWLPPLAQRAADNGQTEALDALVKQVVAFHQQNPDPGTSTTASTANANTWGWDEGTTTRRLEAENHLYALTKDARLVPGLVAGVAVQYGPRFYGPPKYPVHNHGVMADRGIIAAADLLNRSDWRARSITRLVSEAPLPWTKAGWTKEQSSSYHLFNVRLWRGVAEVLSAHLGADDPSAKLVTDLTGKADRISAWLTEPDGRIVVLGDSVLDEGSTRSRWTVRTLRDDEGGLVVGRWSWTDPRTTYYTVRYGPLRWAHGQQERAGITWSTLGRRILVNPGKAPYDPAGNYRSWARWPSAHNVATLDGHTFRDEPVTMSASTIRADWHHWRTTDAFYGVTHVRQYSVAGYAHQLVVRDTYPSSAGFRQFWHLDPAWQLVARSSDRKRLTFKAGVNTLGVVTTGVASVVRGSTRPVAGWTFPDGASRISACEIQISASTTATTTFTAN
jgi:hypothetical protein